MTIICTTSDKYAHLLPIFTHLFNKAFDNSIGGLPSVTIAGYQSPSFELPENFIFHSMGIQGHVSEWSTDLRKYFESVEDDWILWLMEDTLTKSVNESNMNECCALMMNSVGRIDLTCDIMKREHTIDQFGYVTAHPNSRYRLSTQPSIWNKAFLLQYLTDGLTPWEFETQDPKNDGWQVVGLKEKAIDHNEGVRRFDIHKLDLSGFDEQTLSEIKNIQDGINIQ